jgi:DNA-binding MarR family transcriptional regulator
MNNSVIELFDEPDEALTERAAELLPEISKLLHSGVARLPRACGLSIGQIKTVCYLASQGRQTVGEIATGIGVAMPTASELVDRLVESGLAERAVNPANRRQVHVWLTPEAIELATEISAQRQVQLRTALGRLTPTERAGFVRSLEIVAGALRHQSSVDRPDQLVPGRR